MYAADSEKILEDDPEANHVERAHKNFPCRESRRMRRSILQVPPAATK